MTQHKCVFYKSWGKGPSVSGAVLTKLAEQKLYDFNFLMFYYIAGIILTSWYYKREANAISIEVFESICNRGYLNQILIRIPLYI